jgi:hypothetical protein
LVGISKILSENTCGESVMEKTLCGSPLAGARRSVIIALASIFVVTAFSGRSAAAFGAASGRAAAIVQGGTPFNVPQWTSLRIRMDDTLTSQYSMEGDPFSATVTDAGAYQGARVYGTIQTIDNSGRFRGHTTMILVFNRLVMPDGQRAPISAEIIRLYHAPSGEFVDVEGAIESGGRGKNTFIHTGIGAGAGALLGGIFGGGRGAGVGSIVGGLAGLGTTGFSGPQVVKLDRGLEMLIRVASSGQ